MRTLLAVITLLFASTAFAQKVCPNEANQMPVSEEDWEFSVVQPHDTTTCNARPADRKLLSPECPTCPLIWVYLIDSDQTWSAALSAAAIWNRAFGRTIVSVEPWNIPLKDVPTYGVTLRRNNTYTMPSGWAGFFVGHSSNIASDRTQRCYRDDIRINNGYMTNAIVVQTIAHEIGHALIRDASWHSDYMSYLMYESTFDGSNRTIDAEVRRLLQVYVIKPVLDGRMSLPCALRGIGC
jgi:hypothetical protein